MVNQDFKIDCSLISFLLSVLLLFFHSWRGSDDFTTILKEKLEASENKLGPEWLIRLASPIKGQAQQVSEVSNEMHITKYMLETNEYNVITIDQHTGAFKSK